MDAYQVVIQGCGSVGKSAITIKFVHGVFVTKYDPTIEDSYRKPYQVNDSHFVFEIVDTAGTDQFASMRDLYVKNGDAFILVCAINNRSTLNEISQLHQEILDIKEIPPPIVIAVNKIDLPADKREITESEVESLGKKLNVPYFLTSAASGENIDAIFKHIGSKLLEKNNTTSNKKSKSCTLL